MLLDYCPHWKRLRTAVDYLDVAAALYEAENLRKRYGAAQALPSAPELSHCTPRELFQLAFLGVIEGDLRRVRQCLVVVKSKTATAI